MGKNKSAKSRNNGMKGSEGFEKYYSELFKERWPQLKKSLLEESVYAEFCMNGCEKYFLDPASVFAASQLPVENCENLLDLCAAPGGKTLIISSRMEKESVLVSNERSAQRKQRLVQVVDTCLPESVRARIKISCSDGSKWCTTQTECYDSILLDAPCSSERHVLQDLKYLEEWSPSRIKSLAMEQWALISSAYRLLVPGGYLLYSTCALCPEENDMLIARLLKKFPEAKLVFESCEPVFPEMLNEWCRMPYIPVPERTSCGFHILPDSNKGSGPIWFSLIKKMNDSKL